MVLVAVTILAGAKLPRWYHWGVQAGATFAFGFCIWLWYSAVYVIGVLCPYCMVVWSAVIPLFVVVTTRNILTGVISVPPRVRELTAAWWWALVALVFLGAFASIVIQFSWAFTG